MAVAVVGSRRVIDLVIGRDPPWNPVDCRKRRVNKVDATRAAIKVQSGELAGQGWGAGVIEGAEPAASAHNEDAMSLFIWQEAVSTCRPVFCSTSLLAAPLAGFLFFSPTTVSQD